jgi:hypothetical protein
MAEFTTVTLKKAENHGGFSFQGHATSQTSATDGSTTMEITAPPPKKDTSTLTVNHPPPQGAANQVHNLKKGDRVTIFANGNILIQEQ